MLQNYLKKSDSFVGGTLTGFFCIFTIGIIPNFVENYNFQMKSISSIKITERQFINSSEEIS